ncbi:hypothetical protein HJFPF1_07562 [Paramyrothecium foliicola]|nr:hypothetical protein HJFPF1_07562 [Paramyrothecium foliicola]
MAEHNTESLGRSAFEDLESLLSADSYLDLETLTNHPAQDENEQPLFHDAIIESASELGSVKAREVSSISTGSPDPHNERHVAPQASRVNDQGGPMRRKRGRPRKNNDSSASQRPEERRRDQLRRAQHAFRSRREADLANNKSRIEQLQTALEKMSSTVLSFGEELTQSDLLIAKPALQSRLGDLLTSARELVKQNGVEAVEGQMSSSAVQNPTELLDYRIVQIQRPEPSSFSSPPRMTTLPPHLTIDHGGFPKPLCLGSPLLFDTNSVSIVDIPFFVRQLTRACTYHAYFCLRDPSIPLQDLRGKFRFLLSMLSRENLTSYYEAATQAEIYPAGMNDWSRVPYLRIGGAGTHYLKPSSLSHTAVDTASEPTHGGSLDVEHPARDTSHEAESKAATRWFDICDLEGFLQKKHVRLVTNMDKGSRPHDSNHDAVNPSNLIRTLIESCVCLGRSPGWRSFDVEQALRAAAWTSDP